MVEPVLTDPPPPVSRATIGGVVIFVVTMLVLLIFFVPDAEPKIAPEVTDPAQIYAQGCAVCHGANGEGKNQFPKVAGTAKKHEEIMQLLEFGKGAMPAMRGSPEQREAVAKWVKELKPK